MNYGGPFLRFEEFERAAREAYDAIPDAYRAGVDGLVVSRDAVPHPSLPEIFTLGECLTEDWASDFGGPETTRSVVALYWGSFKRISAKDPDFDWEDELWETLTHELRHHLESLARDDALEGVDYALDELFNRYEGHDFDPWYYQRGEDLGGGVYQVERAYYVEQIWRAKDFEAARWVTFTWGGTAYRIPRPDELGDVHYVWVEGVRMEPNHKDLELVLVRHRSWWEDARRMFGTYRPVVIESEALAEPSPASG